jgi:hypothetical protein
MREKKGINGWTVSSLCGSSFHELVVIPNLAFPLGRGNKTH